MSFKYPGYRWISQAEERLQSQHETLTELREKSAPLNARKFLAIPFRLIRFFGYSKQALLEMRRRNRKNKFEHVQVFNFGHLYFVGTKEEYKKL